MRLRCNLCLTVFTAALPTEAGTEKYEPSAVAMMAILRYGSGLPLYRLAMLQGSLGIPLPPSTQWHVVSQAAPRFAPLYDELILQAAQGEVLHNDDTGMKILALMKETRALLERDENDGERSGIFSSAIVSVREAQSRIALFFTGRKHAGENLERVLEKRGDGLSPPIQMCDALSRNVSGDFETIIANCLSHARRQYVDVAADFPDECRHVLGLFGIVYKTDAEAQKLGLGADARLALHRGESRDAMMKLRLWTWRQFRLRRVEPNSTLGEAIRFLRRHWRKLTRFLYVPGAPLDNNLCERILKRVILHRKNSLFYKTQNGARVGDLYMSLISSAQLAGANPFDYLREAGRHHRDVAERPAEWMPWNYGERLATLQAESNAPP